ncbi:MAG: CRISPR-associated endonuclease Cas2 [Ktedonobacteraceae bacterium]|nr:CRISPR-associated endonuclease Cas2 [Ktedonobacteraceae bacterium]
MRYLLIYDISHDGARNKVADTCLDYGLARIQYSAFLGELSAVHQRELLLKIRRRLGKHGANIQLFPLDERAWSGRQVIEHEEKATHE